MAAPDGYRRLTISMSDEDFWLMYKVFPLGIRTKIIRNGIMAMARAIDQDSRLLGALLDDADYELTFKYVGRHEEP